MMDRDRFGHCNSIYYELEDWDSSCSYPTRSALEGVGPGHVTDEAVAAGKPER